ncbi:hypothetical protein E2542_SST08939 [Spatholobus suberectus]|nr:hypothetical protein E2542_SST08939 [Spatholobus suberectus]
MTRNVTVEPDLICNLELFLADRLEGGTRSCGLPHPLEDVGVRTALVRNTLNSTLYIWFYWQRYKEGKGNQSYTKKSLSTDMELYVGPKYHVEWMMQLFYPRQLENGE